MASTNFVDNSTVIYAAWLNDVNNAVYNGVFAASSISPTNLVCNGSVSGTGFTGLVNNTLSSPGAIGSVTPNTGKFTTLQATSLTGLTTPLSVGQGGTGLTAVGASGNVLISNGTTWTSVAPSTVGLAKAWVRFNGTNGSIYASYNVTSVTRNSTGDYTINFTNALTDTNYAVIGSTNSYNSGNNGGICVSIKVDSITGTAYTLTTSAVEVIVGTSGTIADTSYVSVAIFR
jgi:hypothetical protein